MINDMFEIEDLSELPEPPRPGKPETPLGQMMRQLPAGKMLLVRPTQSEANLGQTQRRVASQGVRIVRAGTSPVRATWHTRIDKNKNGVWVWQNASS